MYKKYTILAVTIVYDNSKGSHLAKDYFFFKSSKLLLSIKKNGKEKKKGSRA